MRNHGADKTHWRGICLDLGNFTTKRGRVRNGSCKFEACAKEYTCNRVFGKQFEGKTFCIVVATYLVHGRGQIDYNKAEGSLFTRRADDSVFEIHGPNIEFSRGTAA